MGEQQPVIEHKRFGQYLKRVREDCKLSLDAVEEMSVRYPGRVTKSHLSRIENGWAIPSFPRMFALSQIYRVPITSLAEEFGSDLARGMIPAEVLTRTEQELRDEADRLIRSGCYTEALSRVEVLIERYRESDRTDHGLIQARLYRVTCLQHLARYTSAKEECENLLSETELEPGQRVIALEYFAMSCFRLGKFAFALMAIEQAEKDLAALEDARHQAACLAVLKGNVLTVTGRWDEAVAPYSKAIKGFLDVSRRFEACRARINLGYTLMERQQYAEARKQLETSIREAETQGYDRQLAHGLSNLALLSYRQGDAKATESLCIRSNTIARPREFASVVFRNCFYLWKVALARGDLGAAKSNERSMRAYLSRVEEFLPEAQTYRRHLADTQVDDQEGAS